ncbi:AMP-binding protein [Kitasatospora purpeofusca]|uniref:AMP-binding protein n=1 Tax=Kitasatospora purpeofusca TaxID=67352 RepID=UPI0022596683|nr:AMP-binding protein [Kitasatospora purpeofusca]MCX4689907.1 AMP-binding protein [Kitasatospora purpeofusca]
MSRPRRGPGGDRAGQAPRSGDGRVWRGTVPSRYGLDQPPVRPIGRAPSWPLPGVVISTRSTVSAVPAAAASAPGTPDALTLTDLLDDRAARHPDRPALIVPGRPALDYRTWRERAVRAAHGLARAGVRPGERVLLLFPNRSWDAYAVAFLAAHYAGAAAVVVREDLNAEDTARLAGDSGAVLAVAASASSSTSVDDERAVAAGLRCLPLAALETDGVGSGDGAQEPPHRPAPGDLAQVIGTSGTTGAPKGVHAAHASLTAGQRLDPRPRPYAHSAHAVHAFPIGTNAAQVVLVNALVAAPATICLPRFDAEEFGRTVAEHRAGTVFLVPSMAVELLNSGAVARHDLSSVLLISSSAAALPAPVAAALREALPTATLVNTYTSAEASPAQISAVVDARRPGSVGRPANPADLRLLDEHGQPVATGTVGEVWLRQPGPPRGYTAGAQATAAVFRDGWVRMGDLGRLDADGYLHLVDRESDIIKSGALKVSTLRIEDVLHAHPRVADAAALGLPHPVMGAVPVAAVVPAADGLDLDELRLFLAARLGRAELPVRILVTDRLPRNPSGKVVKHELRARFDTPAGAPAGTPPTTGTETALAAVWRKVLGRPVAAVEDEFFALGGDSFRAVQLAAAVSAEFGVTATTALVFERPSLRAQAAWIATAPRTAGAAPPVEDAALSPFLRELRAQPHDIPLTSQQENFLRWTAEAEGRNVGSVAVMFRVAEALDPGLLTEALYEAVRRHPALRTRFVPVPGALPGVRRAVVDPEPQVEAILVDAPGESDDEVSARLIAVRDRLTDVGEGPMTGLAVVSRAADDHAVLLAVHHIVSDGWSVGVLLRDLGVIYSALRRGRPAPPPRPMPTLGELVTRSNANWPVARAHFARTLAGAPEAVHPFPGRADTETVLSAAHRLTVPAERAAALRARAAEAGATPFQVLATVWLGLLAEHSGQDDLVLMTPVPGRTTPEAEQAVGCFVQSLLLRVDASGGPGFAELLARVRDTATSALDHQLYPFAEFSPLVPFAAWLRYESWNAPAQLPGLACTAWEVPRGATVSYPMPGGDRHVPELAATEQPDGSLVCWLRYNEHAFTPAVVESLATALEARLTEAAGG